MIQVTIGGKFYRPTRDTVKIGDYAIECDTRDLRYLNTTHKIGDELTCLCSLEGDKLYYRFATKKSNFFFAAGIMERTCQSSNPEYLEVHIIEEHVADSGDKFGVTDALVYVKNDTETFKKLRKIRFGDVIGAYGVIVFDEKKKPFLIAKEIETLNTFLVLSGIENILPFDELKKDMERMEELKKEDF